MSNYCQNCYELTEELENHKRWLNDYKQKLQDAEEFANAKITQCANLIKQLNETHKQLDQLKLQIAYKEADEEELKRIIKPYLVREDDLEFYNLDWIIKGFCNQLDQLKIECENWQSLCKHADKQIDELEAENTELKNQRDQWISKCEQETKSKELFENIFDEIKQKINEVEK